MKPESTESSGSQKKPRSMVPRASNKQHAHERRRHGNENETDSIGQMDCRKKCNQIRQTPTLPCLGAAKVPVLDGLGGGDIFVVVTEGDNSCAITLKMD